MFEKSRYLLKELSDLNITESPHSICRLSGASSAKNASFANVNLCLFCRLRQHYKVHTYIISMEFSAVNEGCPILSHRVHWKMGHNDSFDLSNGEYLYSTGKVQLTIRLLHVIS